MEMTIYALEGAKEVDVIYLTVGLSHSSCMFGLLDEQMWKVHYSQESKVEYIILACMWISRMYVCIHAYKLVSNILKGCLLWMTSLDR